MGYREINDYRKIIYLNELFWPIDDYREMNPSDFFQILLVSSPTDS